jgi:hypothetical protein
MPLVQLVTTCNCARTKQWAEQDRVHEQARQWVEEANAQQGAEMQTKGDQCIAKGKEVLMDAKEPASSEVDPDISDLAGLQVTMTLEQLLRLVPRFREGIRRTLEGTTLVPAPAVQLTEVDERIMECECPSIEAIIGGQKVTGILIDGGSGVNVINMATCWQLGITKWEPCKFWLRMANGSLFRPIGMISDLEMVVQGHTFTISVVIMDLPQQDAYPILLGRPWLWSAKMKNDWPKNVLTFRRGGRNV